MSETSLHFRASLQPEPTANFKSLFLNLINQNVMSLCIRFHRAEAHQTFNPSAGTWLLATALAQPVWVREERSSFSAESSFPDNLEGGSVCGALPVCSGHSRRQTLFERKVHGINLNRGSQGRKEGLNHAIKQHLIRHFSSAGDHRKCNRSTTWNARL